jgi:hypothetical protein
MAKKTDIQKANEIREKADTLRRQQIENDIYRSQGEKEGKSFTWNYAEGKEE